MRHLFALAVFASMLPLSAAYGQVQMQSQEGIALENQILQLQQQMQGVQSGGGGNGGSAMGGGSSPAPSTGVQPDPTVITSLLTEVQQLQAQVQQLNGEVDTLQNQVNTQHDASEKEIGDLKFQMTNGATPGAPGAPGAPSAAPPTSLTAGLAPVPSPQAAPLAGASPKTVLRAGQLALSQHDYKTAETSARNVLATSKSSPEGYQAQFLLGQSLAGQGRPQDAAIAYDDAYNRSRTGSNAPASLLGLANSLTAIHQAAAACDTLASLNSQFPTPPADLAPSIHAASRRAHCS